MSDSHLDKMHLTHLADELRRVERATSRSVAIKFAALYGGASLSVPGYENLNADHLLVLDFGWDTALEIVRALSELPDYGCSIVVPTAAQEFQMRQIFHCYSIGMSADETAQELSIHRASVFRTLKDLRQAGIVSDDPVSALGASHRHFSDGVKGAPKGCSHDRHISILARALRVPRAAVKTYLKSKK